MQHDHVLKKLNFDILIPSPKSTQGVRHRSKIQHHVWYVSYLLYLCLQLLPCCCIRDCFDVQHDHVLKKLNFDLLWVEGAAGKIFATMLLHSRFPLIWYATWSCSAKVKFDLLTLGSGRGGGGGAAGKIFATMLLHLWLPLILYAIWPCSEKVEFLTFWPPGSGGWGGLWA